VATATSVASVATRDPSVTAQTGQVQEVSTEETDSSQSRHHPSFTPIVIMKTHFSLPHSFVLADAHF